MENKSQNIFINQGSSIRNDTDDNPKVYTNHNLKTVIDHSFIYWLIIPIIILWLTLGYIFGFLRENPKWLKTNEASDKTTAVKPFYKTYPPLNNYLGNGYVTFWFDDAWLSQYTNAYPVLKSYQYPAAIGVSTSAVGLNGYTNWAQLRILQSDGWEITNHSDTHDCKMQNWDKERFDSEFQKSSQKLWGNFLTSDIFVSPCGVDSQNQKEAAKNYFIAYRTVEPGFNEIVNINPFDLKVKNIDNNTKIDEVFGWIDNAKINDYWLILVFHKVGENSTTTEEEHYNITNNDFENIAQKVSDSGIEVIVPSQIIFNK